MMIKVENSILKLNNFNILNSYLDFIPSKDNKELQEIDLEADYSVEEYKVDNNSFYQIIFHLKGNRDKIVGYIFDVTASAIFSFSKDIDFKNINKYLFYSALPMIISMVRGYIMNITSYGIYGKYSFPPIDILSLVKNNESEEKK